jgi:maleylacetate reductase
MDVTYEALPMRVVFGTGSLARVPAEAARAGLERPLILSTPGGEKQAGRLAGLLEGTAGIFAGARMHVPVEVAAEAVAAAKGADGCVAIGGGSPIGLGKAVALETGLPLIAVPTTYSGSEMTTVWGLTENGRKRTGRDPSVLPVSVVYDPALTLGLPVDVSVVSGMNALAHAVEALYAPDGSPIVDGMAERAARSLAMALPAIAADPRDARARENALAGAWMCGACLGATTMSLHHKLCHVLGGTFDLPHAATHTVVLPYVAAFNLPAAPESDRTLRRAFGTDDVPGFLASLAARLGAPTSLTQLGLTSADLPTVVDQVLEQGCANPREPTREALERLLDHALRGAGA